MTETIEKRLSDLGVTLPVAAAPAANYVPYCRTGNLLFTAMFYAAFRQSLQQPGTVPAAGPALAA